MSHKAKITIRIGANVDTVKFDFGAGQVIELDRAEADAGRASDGKGSFLPPRVALRVIREATVAQAARNWGMPVPGVSERSGKGKKWRKQSR
jgi:hypothetical protein